MKTELERLQQNLAVPNSLHLEPPVFANGEQGPRLSFFQSVEDGVRKLNVCWRHEDRIQVIVLEAADVKELAEFCLDWRLAGMDATTLQAEVDGGLDRIREQLRELAQRRAAR